MAPTEIGQAKNLLRLVFAISFFIIFLSHPPNQPTRSSGQHTNVILSLPLYPHNNFVKQVLLREGASQDTQWLCTGLLSSSPALTVDLSLSLQTHIHNITYIKINKIKKNLSKEENREVALSHVRWKPSPPSPLLHGFHLANLCHQFLKELRFCLSPRKPNVSRFRAVFNAPSP